MKKFNKPITEQPDDPAIRYIALTKGKVAVVDAADFCWLNEWNWYYGGNKTKSYACRTVSTTNGKVTIQMHNAITGKERTDHWDGDSLNNRRRNLREATSSENNFNKAAKLGTKSGLKGVRPSGKKWMASIQKDGKQFYLGTFDTKEEARQAYLEAAVRLYGEFAEAA